MKKKMRPVYSDFQQNFDRKMEKKVAKRDNPLSVLNSTEKTR